MGLVWARSNWCNMHCCGDPQGVVLGISSDGDDQRIFWGLKFLTPRFFCVQKFGKYFFG